MRIVLQEFELRDGAPLLSFEWCILHLLPNSHNYHENNFGMTPLECLEIKIKKEIFNGNFDFVSKIIDVYDKNSKIYTHRVICKKENMIKMRQNFIKLIDNKKLMVIQNLIM